MVEFRVDLSVPEGKGVSTSPNTNETTKGQASKVMPENKNLKPYDEVQINTPNADIDPDEVEKAKLEQRNKALELREDSELETFKDSLRNSINENDMTGQVDALEQIAKIETKRLDFDRCNESTQNLCGMIARALTGADVTEELEDLLPKETNIFQEVTKELSKVSEQNRGKIPLKLIIFAIKRAQGDYSSYTPKEAKKLVENKMYRESVANAPIIAMELKDFLPSKERAAAANHTQHADSARQNTIDLTGFDPKTGKHIKQ